MASIEETANEAKQTPPPSPAADQGGDGDGEDRISGLCDDVLVRILELAVIDARELVRTGVLSRRWRGLWTRVPSLLFSSPWLELESAVGRYVAFVNNVLAQRARSESEASIDLLQAILDCKRGQRQQLAAPAVEAAEAWIRYAMQHRARRLFFSLDLPLEARKGPDYTDLELDDEEEVADEDQSDSDDDGEDKPVIDLAELPSSAKLESMCLWLTLARVRLPSTAVFTSLKDLTLEYMDLAPGSGHLLARLSSSACCPSLQWLRIAHVRFWRAETRELVLDAGELLQLSLDTMDGMWSLELRTPSLLRLDITECDELRSLRVSALALEELTFENNHRSKVAIHGDFPCVWRLKTDLVSHSSNDDVINDASICLVKRYSSSATSLLVHLYAIAEIERRVDLIKDKIPQLPNVTSLSVNIDYRVERHSFGDGVAGLLTRLNNLEYLSIQLDSFGWTKRDEYYSKDADGDQAFTCNHAGRWESNACDISLGNLREASFRGMTGTGCELRFLQMVVASATGLERVTVSFSLNYNLEDSRMYYFVLTLLGDGAWTVCENEDHDFIRWYDKCSKLYKWTPSPMN